MSFSATQCALATLALAGAMLGGAQVLEHAWGLAPCPLCVMQRVWVVAFALVSFAALVHNPRWGIYPVVGIVMALVGAGFSIRQLYLQGLPLEARPSCGPDLGYMLDNFPLSDLLSAMTSGTGDCAEVAGRFLGLSIPGWALLGFFGAIALFAGQLFSRR